VIGIPIPAGGVVISERFFRDHPDVVGRSVRLDGHLVAIAGVRPKDFVGAKPIQPADLFVPMSMKKDFAPELDENSKAYSVLMRLQPGVTPLLTRRRTRLRGNSRTIEIARDRKVGSSRAAE